LSSSNSVSSIARNGAGAAGFTSKRVSGPNLVGTLLYLSFVFIFLSSLVRREAGVIFPTKNPRLTGNRGFVGNFVLSFRKFHPRCQRGSSSGAKWTSVHRPAACSAALKTCLSFSTALIRHYSAAPVKIIQLAPVTCWLSIASDGSIRTRLGWTRKTR